MEICPEIFSDALLLTLTDSIITTQNYFDSIPTGRIDVFFFIFLKNPVKAFSITSTFIPAFPFFSYNPNLTISPFFLGKR